MYTGCANSMGITLILNNSHKTEHFRLKFCNRVTKTLGFCLFREILKLTQYCVVCDDLNKLVIFTIKTGIGMKYQHGNRSVLKVIGEEVEGFDLDPH